MLARYNFRIVPEYKPQTIEKKWQERWRTSRAFEVTEDPDKPKFYCLEMFAYPSGHAHVGHVRNYMIGDVVARMKRMRGFNVLHPFGWDAFGLPAENAAIKNGTHPETWTLENIAHMKGQLQRLGHQLRVGARDRDLPARLLQVEPVAVPQDAGARSRVSQALQRQLVPELPDRARQRAGVDGACWRCGTTVETRELEQWFFRITHYADELLDGIERAERVAREGPDDAAQLDRAVGRGARAVPDRAG